MNDTQKCSQYFTWMVIFLLSLGSGCSDEINARPIVKLDDTAYVNRILVSSDSQLVGVIQYKKVPWILPSGETIQRKQLFLQIYEIETGSLKEEVWFPIEVSAVRLSSQFTHLLTLSSKMPMKASDEIKSAHKIELRDVKGSLLQTFDLENEVGDFGFLEKSSRIWASPKIGYTLSIWSDFDPLHPFVDVSVKLAKASHDGNIMVIFSFLDEKYRLIDLNTHKEIMPAQQLPGQNQDLAVEFSSDDSRLAIFSTDTVVIWDVFRKTKIWDKPWEGFFPPSSRPVRFAFAPTGKYILVMRSSHRWVFDVETGLLRHAFGALDFSGAVHDFISIDGSKMISADVDATTSSKVMTLFDMNQGTQRSLTVPPGHSSKWYGYWTQFTPNGRYIVGLGGGKDYLSATELLLWDVP